MQEPQIAIVGAGPGGLTLASLLETQNINYTIFDLRSKPDAASTAAPSGSLDLHSESGLLALKACGLMDKFHELKTDCTEDMIIADKDGGIQYQDSGSGERPEISRSDLTSLLLSSVPDDKINWEHKLVNVEAEFPTSTSPSPSPPEGADAPRWKLNFQDRPSRVFDLVVGADGAWSRVRPVLTDTKPQYSGVQNLTLTIPHLTSKNADLAALVGKGSYSACGQRKAIMSQRGSQDSARIYVMVQTRDEEFLPSLSGGASKLQEALLTSAELFADWSPALQSLIAHGFQSAEAQNEDVCYTPLYMLPTDHSWQPRRGITLLGDAAHLMTPFAGEGVNAAMLDAVQLSRCIAKKQDFAVYEKKMLKRARSNAEETWRNLHKIFTEDSPRQFVELMQSFGPPWIVVFILGLFGRLLALLALASSWLGLGGANEDKKRKSN